MSPAGAGPSPEAGYAEAPADAVARVAAAFATAVGGPLNDLPLPGGGRTAERWRVLSELAGGDLSVGRLAEGHADALAILAELDGPGPASGSRWGVWAAMPPGPGVTASLSNGRWYLTGTKQYCSGAHACTHALVTAAAPDGYRLFAVAAETLQPVPGTWPALGMAGSDTLNVTFPEVEATPVGDPGAYLNRPGFAHGGAGVAACWFGGARAVGEKLRETARQRELDPHALAHLGAVDLGLFYAEAALEKAAAEIDADPGDHAGAGQVRTLRLRALIEGVCSDVLSRVGRALGASPLCHDGSHARRVADLTVYLRQHHAERNLAELGALVIKDGAAR